MGATYDPALVDVVFISPLGTVILSGFEAGTAIDVGIEEDQWVRTKGLAGECAWTRNHNDMAAATFHLMQTALANERLSEIVELDLANGQGLGQLQITDRLSPRTLFTGTGRWSKPANATYGKEFSFREWKLLLESAKMFLGASPVQ